MRFLVIMRAHGAKRASSIFPLTRKGGGGFDATQTVLFLESLWLVAEKMNVRFDITTEVTPSVPLPGQIRDSRGLDCDYSRAELESEISAALGAAPPVKGDGWRSETR